MLNQTNATNIGREFIFVLDACTDNTEQVIIDYMQRFNYPWYIYRTNYKRAGLARNYGLEHCHGDWVWFLDGDDYLTTINATDKISSCILNNNNTNIIIFKYSTPVAPGPLWNPTSVCTCVIKRDLIGSLRFNSNIIDEDFTFRRDLEAKPEYLEYLLDESLYFYNFPRENSITYNIRMEGQTNAL